MIRFVIKFTLGSVFAAFALFLLGLYLPASNEAMLGCPPFDFTIDDVRSLEIGMSADEVISIIGRPTRIDQHEKIVERESWEFARPCRWSPRQCYFTVVLEHKEVVFVAAGISYVWGLADGLEELLIYTNGFRGEQEKFASVFGQMDLK